jgi:tetratricopeptide (TPR) repeat protein
MFKLNYCLKIRNTINLIVVLLASLMLSTAVFAQKSKPFSESEKIKFDATFIDANKEKIRNNFDESIKLLKECLTLQPDNSTVNFLLSEVYQEKQLIEDAEIYAKRAVKFDAKNTWYKKQLASIYVKQKKYKDAALVYHDISKLDNDMNMEIESAYMFLLARESKKALKSLDNVERKAGVNEEIIKQKEQIYLAQNKLGKAINEIEKLIKAYPNDAKYIGMLADLYMANNKSNKAVDLYLQCIKVDPQNGLANFALADYYLTKGDIEKYVNFTKVGMSSKTTDVKSKLNAMVSFIALKDIANHTNICYDLAHVFIEANPFESTSYLVLGDLYELDKDFESARLQYLKAVSMDASNFMAWQQLIFCSSELRNNSYLQKDCENAIEYFPNQALFYVYLSIASEQLKDYEKAFNSAKKGIEFAADQKEILIQLYSTLGDASHYLKRYGACDSAFEAALQLDSKNSYALNNYAYFLSLRNIDLDKAERLSKQSMEIEPENSSYMDTYGWILFQKKDYENAKTYIEKSLTITPNSAEVIEHLGDVQYKRNQKEEAMKNWKRAKELGSSGQFLDKKIKDGILYE